MLEIKVTAYEEQEMGFAKPKDELSDGFAVKLPNPHKTFFVETDASVHAVGAVVLPSEGETEYPTIFYSETLNTAHRNYSTYERELLAVVKACDAFRVYLLVRECTLRTHHAALSGSFNSPVSSTSRVAKWLLPFQPFRFVVTHIKGEENVGADRVSGIPWPLAMTEAVDVIQLSGELEVDCAVEEESDSDSEEVGEEFFYEDNSAQGEVILKAFDLLKEHQKGETDSPSLAQWLNPTATPTCHEMQATSPYLGVLAEHLDRIAEINIMLVLRTEINGSNLVIVPTSLIGEAIEEAHQGPGTAHGGVKNVQDR